MSRAPTGALRFAGVIRIFDSNPYIWVSATRASALRANWRKPMPALVRVDGHPRLKPWRVNLIPMRNGDFYLYLHGDVRLASDAAVGDRVAIELRFDSAYRNGPLQPMPPWFRRALGKNQRAETACVGHCGCQQRDRSTTNRRLDDRMVNAEELEDATVFPHVRLPKVA